MTNGRNKRDDEWGEDKKSSLDFFDPFSGSAGVDRDFDDPKADEQYIKERLRDRGTF